MSLKLDEIVVDPGSMALTVKRDEGKPKVTKLDDIYEAHAKLVFLFDCSSSMDTRLSANYTDSFIWSQEILDRVRAEAEEIYQNTGGMNFLLSPADDALFKMIDPATGKANVDDEELKRRLVEFDITGKFNVPVDWAKHKEVAPTRSECVKRLAKRECEKRLEKFPNSNIAVVFFSGHADLEFNNGTREQLFEAIDRIYCAGSTDILEAIKKGLKACEDSPSTVGLHHFIVVSDGEDGRAEMAIASWVPSLKASGVVLDYIHIGDRDTNTGLVEACKALGGDCVSVNTEKDLQEKFVEVIQRKALPPA